MQVWISKYALTRGIYCLAGRISQQGTFRSDVFEKPGIGTPVAGPSFAKHEYHLEFGDASRAAEEMRRKKILWHKNQIRKLEKLEF